MSICREDELSDLDVTVTTRPHQSEPVQMPGELMETNDKT